MADGLVEFYGASGRFRFDKPERPVQEADTPEDLSIITGDRKQFLLHINQQVQFILGDNYAKNRLITAATAGSMKDVLLIGNSHGIVMIDNGSYTGSGGLMDPAEFIDCSQEGGDFYYARREYARAYQKTRGTKQGHVDTRNLPIGVGRRAFILWELQELGVDMRTVEDVKPQISDHKLDEKTFGMRFEYRHPYDPVASVRELMFVQARTSDIVHAPDKYPQALDEIRKGYDVVLQKAAEQAFDFVPFQNLLLDNLHAGGVIITDRFQMLKNKQVTLQEITRDAFVLPLQQDIDDGHIYGYLPDPIRIARKVS